MRHKADELAGLYYHSFYKSGPNKGIIENQGRVIAMIGSSHCLVQLYSFATGMPNVKRLIPLNELASWNLYDDREDWIEAYEASPRPKTP